MYARVARAIFDSWRDLQRKQPEKHQTTTFICEIECFPKLFTFIGYDFSFQGLQKHFPFLIVLNYYEIERENWLTFESGH